MVQPRPAPSPLADPLVRAFGAVLFGLLIGVEVPGPVWAWASVALGAVALAAPWRGMVGVRGVLAGAAVGIGVARAAPVGPAFEGEVALIGVRVGASTGRTGDVVLSRVRTPPDPGWTPAGGRVRVRFPADAPVAGRAVVVLGAAGPVRPTLPGAPDPVRAARLAGVRTEVVARSASVVGGEAPGRIPAERDPSGLLRALALGDRSGVDAATRTLLRRTGTSHLLSVSGSHIGAAAGMLAGAAAAVLRAGGAIRPRGVSLAPALLAGATAGWAYTAITGWSVPAQRAAMLLTVVVGARLLGRGVAALPVLVLIAAGIAVLEPGAPASASYQLSFGAMAGLVALTPRIEGTLPPAAPSWVRSGVRGVAATFGATIGTLPFAAWWFQEVAPSSPLANLAAVPWVGLVVTPLAGLTAAAPEPIAAWAASLGTLAGRGLLFGLDLVDTDPWRPAVGPLGAIGLGIAAVLACTRPASAAVLTAAILLPGRVRPEDLRITVLDVGQGDATLVERADGQRWLVDGGRPGSGVVEWLRRTGVRRLDAVVATHADADHAGGLVAVVDQLDVGAVWAIGPPPELVAAAQRRGVPIGPPVGALHPWPDDPIEGDNDGSIVLRVGPILLMGDAERSAEARVAGRTGPAPILRVGHHGSATSTTDLLLDAVQPAVAIVSLGPNRYGHPAPEVLARLSGRGVRVLRTDQHGTVEIERTADGLWVRTARAPPE